MRSQPEYRIRLFLSIDLIGSTALKADLASGSNPQPRETWVKQINHFYSDFPKNFLYQYDGVCKLDEDAAYKEARPKLWKTLGDELIFCVRLLDLQHLKLAVQSFIVALKNYGLYLDERRRSLDVKGSAWICSFPEPNITVKVSNREATAIADFDQLTDEEAECEADDEPHRFDFLGKHVDAGFRIAKFAKHEGLALTVELAYLLGQCCRRDVGVFSFEYEGLQDIEGILRENRYPVFFVDVERNNARKLSRSLEWGLQGRTFLQGHQIVAFLEAFFAQEEIELPCLNGDLRSGQVATTASYKDYIARWLDDNTARAESLKAANRDVEQAEKVYTVDGDVAAGAERLTSAFANAMAEVVILPNAPIPPLASKDPPLR